MTQIEYDYQILFVSLGMLAVIVVVGTFVAVRFINRFRAKRAVEK